MRKSLCSDFSIGHLTRSAFAVVSLFALCLYSAPVWGQAIHYEQNFDNLTDGDTDGQDGWAVGAPSNQPSTIITSQVNHGAAVGKSMEVSASQEVIRNFDPKATSGVHFLSIWFRVENPSTDNTLHIYIGDEIREWSAGPVVRIGAQSGDPMKVGVHNGNDVMPVGDIVPGEWQHLFEVIDVDAQTFTVFLDDVEIATDFAWRNPANHTAIGWLMLGFDGGAGLIGYYDDIVLGEGDELVVTAVEATGKLTTTWATLKSAR